MRNLAADLMQQAGHRLGYRGALLHPLPQCANCPVPRKGQRGNQADYCRAGRLKKHSRPADASYTTCCLCDAHMPEDRVHGFCLNALGFLWDGFSVTLNNLFQLCPPKCCAHMRILKSHQHAGSQTTRHQLAHQELLDLRANLHVQKASRPCATHLHCCTVLCILPLEGHGSLSKAGSSLILREISCRLPIGCLPADS